jgi:serine protease
MNLFRSALCGLAVAAVATLATATTRQPLPIRINKTSVPVIGAAAAPRQTQTRFDRFIVHYRSGVSAARSTATIANHLAGAVSRAGLKTAAGKAVKMRALKRTALGSRVVASSRRLDSVEAERFLAELRSDPQVAWAQPDYIVRPLDTVPTDPRYAQLQWDMHDPVGGVNAPRAWDTGAGEGTVVAVIDTGYVDHSDLAANIVPGYDFVSWYGQTEDGSVYPDIAGDGDGRDPDAHDPGDWTDDSMASWCGVLAPSSWHGSHVAGTVAAVANNAVGIAGLAYGAKVQPVRVMGHCGGLTSDIVDAIVWASGGTVDGVPANPTPAEVLNLSLGADVSCSRDPATQAAVDDALGRGVSVIVAAGNAAQNAANHSPASCAGVVTVGATGVEGGITFYSNFGPNVTLSAPGGGYTGPTDTAFIWSTGNSGTTTPVASPAGDVLLGMVGTSMAAPHVAAVAAMMQSAAVANGHPPLTPSQVKALLKGTVKPFAYAPPPTQPIGTGIVNAAAAVEAAARGYDERDIALPLTNRVATNGIGAQALEDSFFKITVPAGARSLLLRSYGGIGSVSLYIARERAPTAEDYDGVSQNPGNTESITIPNPAGTYYVRLTSPTVYRNVSVIAVVQ